MTDPSAYAGIAEEPRRPEALAEAGLALSLSVSGLVFWPVFWPASVLGLLCAHAALFVAADRREPRGLELIAVIAGWGALLLAAGWGGLMLRAASALAG